MALGIKAGSAWIGVQPNFSGFNRATEKGATEGGRAGGRAMGKAFGEEAEASTKVATRKLSANLGTARNAEATAAGKVRIAEQRLNEVRNNSKAKASQVAAAEENLARAQRGLSTAQDRTKSATDSLSAAQKRNAASAVDVEKKQSKFASGLSTVRGKVSSFASSLKDTALQYGKLGLAGAGAAAAGLGTTALVKGFGRLKSIDDAEGKLRGLGHSAKSTEQIMANALASVKGTAFGMDEAATTAAGTVAAGIKPGKELQSVLTLVGDAATIAGTDMDSMGSIFNKVASSNKIQGDVIAQLSDQGIPVVQFLAKELGVTSGEVTKLASQGKIDFATFRSAMQTGVGGAAQESGKTFTGAMKNTSAALGRLGASALSGVFPRLKSGLGGITSTLDAMGPAAEVAGSKVGSALASVPGRAKGFFDAFRSSNAGSSVLDGLRTGVSLLMPHLRSFGSAMAGLLPDLTRFGTAVGKFLVSAFQAARPYLVAVAAVLGGVFIGALKVIPPVLSLVLNTMTGTLNVIRPLLPVVAGLTAAWVAYRVASAAVAGVQMAAALIQTTVAMARVNAQAAIGIVRHYALAAAQRAVAVGARAWAAAQWLLNAAMSANPVGLVIVGLVALGAAMVVAWKRSSTFRAVVTGAWNGIRSAASSVVGWFRNTAWPWLSSAFRNIGKAGTWLWKSALAPAFRGIAGVVRWWYTNVVRRYFTLVGTVFRGAGRVGLWLYRNALAPAFRGIATVASWLYGQAKKHFGRVQAVFRGAATTGKWLYEKAIRPSFNSIAAKASWLWSKVSWAFDKLKSGATSVKNAIVSARDGIRSAWSKLNGYLREPIRKALSWMNKNFIGGVNKLLSTKILGINKKWRIPTIEGFATGGWTGRGPADEAAGIVHRDEYVVRKKSQRSLAKAAPGFLDALNRHGAKALEQMGAVGYRIGGKVQGLNSRFLDQLHAFNKAAGGRYSVNSGYRSNAKQKVLYERYLAGRGPVAAKPGSSMHNRGLAADLAPSNARDVHGAAFAKRYGLVYTVPSESWHIEPTWGRGSNAGPSSGGGGFGLPSWLSNPLKWVKDKVSNITKGFTSRASQYGIAGQALPSVFKTIRDAAGDKIKKAATSLMDFGGGGGGMSIKGFVAGAGVAQWSTTVRKALYKLGQSPALVNTVLRRMKQESGGNPKAINNWDSNARRGTPSKGLMQVIDPTFRAYAAPGYNRNIYDPMSNILASMRYAIARYGSLSAAYNRSGGYAGGTQYATKGPHWVGEKGPELMWFRGGERVASSSRSQQLTRPSLEGVRIRGRIDMSGLDSGILDGVIEDVLDRERDHDRQLARMGSGGY